MIVAVDGPGGAGKSSVCRSVAHRLGFVLLNTGALYRAVTLTAQQRKIPMDDADALGDLTATLEFNFVLQPEGQRLLVQGVDVTDQLYSADIGLAASIVSSHPPVRAALVDVQRTMGRSVDNVIAEGRDIGTVIFPDADLKVFFTASPRTRAERRWRELQERGQTISLEEVEAELLERDARDRNRAVAPLRQADDAIALDTSTLDFAGTCDALVGLIETRRNTH